MPSISSKHPPLPQKAIVPLARNRSTFDHNVDLLALLVQRPYALYPAQTYLEISAEASLKMVQDKSLAAQDLAQAPLPTTGLCGNMKA